MTIIAQKQALINAEVLLDKAASARLQSSRIVGLGNAASLTAYAEACERDARAELDRAREG